MTLTAAFVLLFLALLTRVAADTRDRAGMTTGPPGEAATDTEQHDRARHLAPTAHKWFLTRRPRPRPVDDRARRHDRGRLPGSSPACHLDLADAQWVNASYAIFAALLLTVGRISDRLGTPDPGPGSFSSSPRFSCLRHRRFRAAPLIAPRRAPSQSRRRARLPSTLSTVSARPSAAGTAPPPSASGVRSWPDSAVSPSSAAGSPQFRLALDLLRQHPHRGAGPARHHPLGCPRRAGTRRRGIRRRRPLTSGIGLSLIVFQILIEGSTYGWFRPVADLPRRQLDVADVSSLSPALVALLVGPSSSGLFVVWGVTGHAIAATPSSISASSPCTFTWDGLTVPPSPLEQFALVFVLLFLVNVLGLGIMKAPAGSLAAMAIGAFVQWRAGAIISRLDCPRPGRPPWPGPRGRRRRLALLLSSTMPAWAVADCRSSSTASGSAWPHCDLHRPGRRSARAVGSGSATQARPDRVGSALGTALVGSTLAASLRHTVAARRTSPAFRRPRGQTHRVTAASPAAINGPGPGTTGQYGASAADRGRAGRGLRRRDSGSAWASPRHIAASPGLAGVVVVDRVAYRDRHGPRRRRARRRIDCLSRMQHGLFVSSRGSFAGPHDGRSSRARPLSVTLLLGWYAAGLALARRTDTNLAIWWLLGLTAVWLGLVLVSGRFVWVAVSAVAARRPLPARAVGDRVHDRRARHCHRLPAVYGRPWTSA